MIAYANAPAQNWHAGGLINSRRPVNTIPYTTNLVGHWMADTGVTKDGGDLVSSWISQDPNSHDAAQGTGSKQPLYVASQINGYPVIRADGTDDILTIPDHADFDFNDFSFFVVANHVTNDNTYNDPIFAKNGNTAAASAVYGVFNYRSGFPSTPQKNTLSWSQSGSWGDRAIDSDVVPISTFYTFDGYRTSGDAKTYRNGTEKASTTLTGTLDTSTGTLEIFGHSGWSSNEYGNWEIAELILYNANIGASNQSAVRDYLQTKYGHY